MVSILWITAALMLLRLAADLVLSALNRAEVRRHADAPPPAVAAIMDGETYRKAVAYTLEKSRFGVLTEIFDTLVLMLVLFGGVLPMLFNVAAGWQRTTFKATPVATSPGAPSGDLVSWNVGGQWGLAQPQGRGPGGAELHRRRGPARGRGCVRRDQLTR